MHLGYSTKGRRISLFLLLLAAFAAGVLVDRVSSPFDSTPPELRRTFAPFWEAWHLVQMNFVDQQAVQPHRMTEGAIEGMLATLGDIGHTSYLTPEEVEQLESTLEGHLEGIGARMTVRKKRPTVMQTIPGSPARAAGLHSGDVLLEVDGKDVSNLPLERIVEIVRGQPGSVVHLRISREGYAKPLDFRIARAKVEVPDVAWHMLPGVPIAHVAISEFGALAHTQLVAALEAAQRQGAKGLILDVRGNPGGLKDQAVAVTSEFLTRGTVFVEEDAHGKRTAVPVQAGGRATDLPLVVLIDEGTASSAEIFTGALQDHGRAKLVGMRTFGTGTVLQPFGLSDGSAVLLAVAKWLTPNGRQIWHEGVVPDFEVPLPEDTTLVLPDAEAGLDTATLAASDDKQLLKALEVLKQTMNEER